jgi:hypothetical protein
LSSRLLRLPSVAELMARLHARRGADTTTLRRSTGFSEKVIKLQLANLAKAGVAKRTRAGMFRLTPGFRVPRVEVWAFEAKTHDWRRALYQALQYRGFAHRIYVVMPLARRALVRKHQPTFRRFGVGVVLIDERNRLRCMIAAQPRAPRSRVMHLRVVGEILKRANRLLNSR